MKNDTTELSDTTALSQNGASRPTLLSSAATLFWRLFVPVFSTVILSSFSLIFWLMDGEDLYLPVPVLWVRIGLTLALIGWVWFLYRTLWRLKRVDADAAHVFVTDYWTTVRYPWSDVEGFSESTHLGRRIAHLHLRSTGRFGQKISFLPASTFKAWLEEKSF